MRVYQITVRNKAAAVALGATVVVVGGALVVVGLTLLTGLLLGGAVLGTGALLIRRLTGGKGTAGSRASTRIDSGLDPAQEVFPPPPPPDQSRQIRSPR